MPRVSSQTTTTRAARMGRPPAWVDPMDRAPRRPTAEDIDRVLDRVEDTAASTRVLALAGWARGSWDEERAREIAREVVVEDPAGRPRRVVEELARGMAAGIARQARDAYRVPWDADAPRVVNEHARRYAAAAWYPRADLLACYATDGRIHVWAHLPTAGRLLLVRAARLAWVDSLTHLWRVVDRQVEEENLGRPGRPARHVWDAAQFDRPARITR